MRIILESTDKLTQLNGVPARIWEGTTERGVPIFALITRVAVREDLDASELEAALSATHAPCSAEVARQIDPRMIL